MALRTNHYDMAFQEYLRHRRIPHVVVDESRRALLQEASLKSMDFVVYSSHEHNLLVDVKGRRFPSGGETNQHKWENWTTEDDVQCLLQWERVFGRGFRSLLIFAYHVVDPRWSSEFETLFEFQQRLYAFYGVWVDEYQNRMRQRSASWETVSLPSRIFHELRLPVSQFL